MKWILMEWVNGNPIFSGASYYDTKEQCLNAANGKEEQLKKLGVNLKLKNIEVKYTMAPINKGNL